MCHMLLGCQFLDINYEWALPGPPSGNSLDDRDLEGLSQKEIRVLFVVPEHKTRKDLDRGIEAATRRLSIVRSLLDLIHGQLRRS